MISATALNASTVPLNKSPQMPLGLDNSRLRDAQKFLVPSLPVSSRPINPRADHHQSHHHHNPHIHNHYQQQQQQQQINGGSASDVGVNKRRERSILNGTAHPIPPPESRLSASVAHNLNGLRSSTSPLGGKGTSPNNYSHNLQCSPRKDAHSPMYAGEVPGFSGSPGSSYSARSSVPIPCSSPSPGSSASPKSSHSLSPNSSSANNYSSHLSSSANGASELSQLAVAAAAAAAATGGRLYPPGFPPPSAAHHAAFYAAAAAAAGHSLPYPSLFGSHFPPHQHPAASSYLDFHSKLLRNSAAAVAAELRSPSQSPPSRSYQPSSPQQQQQILQPLGSPQSTSVTSLHTKLIESVSASGDRYHPHHSGHNHIHSSGSNGQQHGSRFSSAGAQPAGVSKGGPLGISGGIMGLSIPSNANQKGHAGHATSSESSSKSGTGKLYMEHPGIPGSSNSNSNSSNSQQQERSLLAEMELINGNKNKEALLAKHRMLTRSPDDFSGQQQQQQHQPPQKMAKSISFASDVHSGGIHRAAHHPYMNGHGAHPQIHHPQHTQGHHQMSNNSGPTNLSTDCNKRANGNNMNTTHAHSSSQQQQQHHNHLFLPPSPKKRSAQWNFAVPQSPMNNGGKMGDIFAPPPPPSSSDAMSEASALLNSSPSKYLSQTQQNQKPSNGGPGPSGSGIALTATTPSHHHYQSTNAQQLLVVPSSPLSLSPSSHGGGSGPSTPKSPSVHFKFFSSTNKENNGATGRNGKIANARNDSSSSTSSVELGVINGNGKNRQNIGPWPVEQMPLISAFRKGSLIKLASGDMKAVEDLREEDFEKAVQMMADSVKIVYCPVISIGENADSSLCVVTLAMGAALNQQVVVESSPEQPFFIRGRGWSSPSPKLTEKILHLPCTMLAVGDICITLTRHVKKQTNASSGGIGNHHPTPTGRGAKSKAGATRPYGTYAKSRNASTSSILKSSHQLQQRSNTNGTRMNGRKLVSGPATNLDVNNSSTNVISGGLTSTNITNPANPISSKQQTEKGSSGSDKEERQDKTEEKQVNLSVANSNAPSTTSSAAIPSDQNSSSSSSNNAGSSAAANNATGNSSDSKDSSDGKSAAPILSYKRKSISPCPVGSPEKNENEETNDKGEEECQSPKKRRWSAPDQIEVESPNAISTGEGTASSIVKADVALAFTTGKSLDATALAFATRRSSDGNERKEDCEGQKDGQKYDGNKNCVQLETNDRKSPNVPPSKSLTSSLN